MNPFQVSTIATLFSMKRELKIVLGTFLGILLLPFIAVLVITNTGIPVVSDHLASVNIKTHKVEIHDPATGKVIATIDVATTWPVAGVITLEFGESDLPYQPFHTGIDIANPNGKIGDPVTPFMKGKVIYADEINWGYGKHVIVDNGNNITSIYAHLSEIDTKVGATVAVGDIIGKEGMTGWATGPHVHFQINVFGIPVNPRTFVMGNP